MIVKNKIVCAEQEHSKKKGRRRKTLRRVGEIKLVCLESVDRRSSVKGETSYLLCGNNIYNYISLWLNACLIYAAHILPN